MLVKDNFFMTLMKLKLDFLFTDFSQHFRIYLVVFALKLFIHGPKYKTRIFRNLRNRLLREIN